MKILLLHLSDSHFNADIKFGEVGLYKMVSALKQVGDFDECLMLFSGDITNTAEQEQFTESVKFYKVLIRKISEEYLSGKRVSAFFVPGNHDIQINPDDRMNLDIANCYKDKSIGKVFNEELTRFDMFYEFANSFRCFKEDKVLDIQTIIYGDNKLQINLLNTAPLSMLGSANTDKGLHFFPDSIINRLNADSTGDYVITIMHHGPEWFSDSIKNKLYNSFIEKTDLLFVGHEHFSLSESKYVNGKPIDISSGLALWGTKGEHGFNALVLDTDERTLIGQKFTYDKGIFRPVINLNKKKIKFHTSNGFDFTNEFDDYLKHDENDRYDCEYDSYYVFPTLEPLLSNSGASGGIITSEDKFLELLKSKNRVSIEGGSKSGKSILAKYLCRFLADKEYTPVLINKRTSYGRNCTDVVENALREQHGKKVDIDAFYQLDKSKKVLIIDNFDYFKQEDRVLLLRLSQPDLIVI